MNSIYFYRWFFLTGLMVCVSSSLLGQFTQRSRRDVAVEEVKREKTDTKRPTQPNRSFLFTVEVEKQLIAGIDKTIAFYQRQYQRMPKGSPQRLNVMMRVLDLNLEQASYARNEEERVYSNLWERWDAGGRKGREPKVNTKKSMSNWGNVIRLADLIDKEYPRNPDADRVLFIKGFSFSFIGKETEAAKIFTELIQKYPKSKSVGDAYSALGDYYFDRNDFQNAKNNYQQAIRFRGSSRYSWSLFKIAWCEFNLGRVDQALSAWMQVVAQSKRDKAAIPLKDEALRDMVYAFAEKKDINGAIAYYRRESGTKYIADLLLLLSAEFTNQGAFQQAITTLKRFQSMFPTHPQAPDTQKEVLQLIYDMGRLDLLWRELMLMDRMFAKPGPWVNANQKDRELVVSTFKLAKDQKLYYAKVLHKRAQQTDSTNLHNEAKRGYMLFLQYHPSAPEVVEVKYNLGDIEYFLKDYRASGQQYLDITVGGKEKAVIVNVDAKTSQNVHKESAVYMVDSYARDFQKEFEELRKSKPDFKGAGKKPSEKARNYIRACTIYVKAYPEDKKLVKTCETDIARVFYHLGNRNLARRYFWLIAMKYPKEKEGPAAVDDLIPLYANDQPALLKIADRLLAVPEYSRGELGARLRRLKQGAAKEAVEREKDPLQKAKAYEALVKRDPKDPEADILLYKAADNYLAAGAIAAALSAYSLILKDYPKSSQAKAALIDSAQIREKLLEYSAASVMFDRFGRSYGDDQRSKGALIKACDLKIALDASDAYRYCLSLKDKIDLSAYHSILFDLAKLAERGKSLPNLEQVVYSHIEPSKMTPSEKIISIHRVINIGPSPEKMRRARETMLKYAKNSGLDPEASRYVTDVYFEQTKAAFASYTKVRVVGGTIDKLQASIAKKGEALVSLKTATDTVLNTKDSYWGVAALYMLGVAHVGFAEMLENPPGIQGAKVEDLRARLAPDAKALRTEGDNYYKNAAELVRKFNIYNEWSIKVINASLAARNSTLELRDWIVEADFLSSDVSETIVKELGSY